MKGQFDNELLSYPAFTVAELGVMLPDVYKLPVNKGEHGWWSTDAPFHKTEAEARAALLLYLLENNHVTAEEVNQGVPV